MLYITPLYLMCCFLSLHFLSVCHSDWVTPIILSSRSTFFHSSLLFSLLFIASRLVFISPIELSNFDWFFFTLSSSLLQWSAFPSDASFSNPSAFLLSSFLNLGSNSVVKSISLFVLSWNFSCSFNWNGSSAFSFHLNFLCLCEFRSSYLVGVWRCPYVDCIFV